ncbi:MAG: hypothetical protein JSW58_08655 [Candidatus Latescibacterota bacterium]|nr:MAG: hypothetical protein JSW58_08655 [Candidatus Latescibacterota bacterium]
MKITDIFVTEFEGPYTIRCPIPGCECDNVHLASIHKRDSMRDTDIPPDHDLPTLERGGNQGLVAIRMYCESGHAFFFAFSGHKGTLSFDVYESTAKRLPFEGDS